jgi:hypothetical protein
MGREVSCEEILEAIQVVDKFPLPWKEYHKGSVKWLVADTLEATTRYLRNPAGYHTEVEKRHRERVQSRQPFFLKQSRKRGKPITKQNKPRSKGGARHSQRKKVNKVPREVFAQLARQASELARNHEWEDVCKVCRWWLALSPRSQSAMYRLAWALFNLDQLDEAEELCKNIRSSFRLNPDSGDTINSLLEQISAKKTLALENESPERVLLTGQPFETQPNLPWASQISNPLLVPDLNSRETWITQRYLLDIAHALEKRDHTFDVTKLEQFGRQCWAEIKAKRRYQVPSQGRAEILTSEKLSDLVELRLVRFVQEGANAPEVFVRFGFGEPSAIGIAKIRDDGSIQGFYEFSGSDLLGAIVEATALAYYRDLVVPTRVYHSQSSSSTQQVRATESNEAGELTHPKTASVSQHPIHRLPRTQVVSPSKCQTYRLEEWHHAQERARHKVIGHTRWVGQHFIADSSKIRQSREAGVELPPGYTWVVEHDRGGRESGGLRLSGLDLAERTRFLPPEQASFELDQLLS